MPQRAASSLREEWPECATLRRRAIFFRPRSARGHRRGTSEISPPSLREAPLRAPLRRPERTLPPGVPVDVRPTAKALQASDLRGWEPRIDGVPHVGLAEGRPRLLEAAKSLEALGALLPGPAVGRLRIEHVVHDRSRARR